MIKDDNVTIEQVNQAKFDAETIILETLMQLQQKTGVDITAANLEWVRHDGEGKANTITAVNLQLTQLNSAAPPA